MLLPVLVCQRNQNSRRGGLPHGERKWDVANGYGQKPASVLSHLAAKETGRSSATLTLDLKTSVLSSIGDRSQPQDGDRRIETLIT